jgi:hypothetical protein
VRVVVACRSHDLKYDHRLRRLLTAESATGDNGGPESFAEVHVGDLSPEQVRQAVGLLGLPEGIPPPLVTLLGNAFNLSLLADVVSDASARGELADLDLRTFRTRMDLLAEYHRRVDRRLQPTLGLNQYTQAVFRIARQLGDSGQLSLTQNAVTDIAGTVDVLLHEGVLAASGRRLRFFHEARNHRTRMLIPALEAVLDDPAEQVRAMLPPAIVRTYLAGKDAAVHLAERWLDGATDDGLHAPELERLAWQLTRPSQGIRLIRLMLISAHDDVRTRAGQLAALISLRQPDSMSDGGTATAESLLRTALQNTAARKGVAALLAELVDELSENPSQADGAARPVRPDKHLLIALLDDTDSEVRSAALRFAGNLTQPLDQYRDLLAATGASQAFREHPGAVLHALSEQAGDLPTEALDLCERWFADNTETISDIRTAAAGDAYSVTDIVLSIHARTAVGSAERTRCLDLLDRLIEAGAAEANKKADDAAYAQDL